MKLVLRTVRIAMLTAAASAALLRADGVEAKPVTPGASAEAVALLHVLHDISGVYTLTGQHNYPNTRSRNSEFAARYIGKTPAIWGSDWGHAKAGDSDSYLARPDIVQEAIRQHKLGSLVTLCWHAVPPTADEPITFLQLPHSDPNALSSVQGKLLDGQFRDVLTPGTPLYARWCAQVDAVAVFLKQLQDAQVPVLWRPYHEMNGDWFWWGARTGAFSTAALYRQLFDRLVHHHHLTNLIWVWSVDRPSRPGMEHAAFFPGIEFVDVLALDVYGSDFAKSYYDSLVALSQGKPIVLAEVGNPPTPQVLSSQPRWAYYMTWAGMVRNTSKKQYAALVGDPRILSREDPAYWRVMAPFRKACGLPPLHFEPGPVDFSGTWVLNEEKSDLGRMGASSAPASMVIVHAKGALSVRSTLVVEYGDNEVTEQTFVLDGSPSTSRFRNSQRISRAKLSASGDKAIVESGISLEDGNKMTMTEAWSLIDGGEELSITRQISSARGERSSTLIFDRR